MLSLNKVELIGYVVATPSSQGMQGASPRAYVRLVEKLRPVGGLEKTIRFAELHTVVMHGRLARLAVKYLRKGDRVYVSGRVQTTAQRRSDGTRQTTVEIVANNMIMLGGKARFGPETRNECVVEEKKDDKGGEG